MASLLKFITNGGLRAVNRNQNCLAPSILNHNSVDCYSKLSSETQIVRKLGISEPPKRPLTAFFRFKVEIANGSSTAENVSKAALRWRQMSKEQKQKYRKEYEEEMAEYSKLYKVYENNLTLNQKLAINVNQMELKENKIKSSGKIHLNFNCKSNFNEIYRKLGIAEPPKRPLTNFFRFMQETSSTESLPMERVRKIASQWKQLSDEQKEKYKTEYKKEMTEYRKTYKEYVNNLTLDQKLAINAAQMELRKNEIEASYKAKLKNEKKLEKRPKRPLSPFFIFLNEKCKNNYYKPNDLINDWNKLSDEEKQSYNQISRQAREPYMKQLEAWEDKMIAEGKPHLVRKMRFVAKSAKEPKPSKKEKSA